MIHCMYNPAITWSFIYRGDGWNINSMNIAENRILLCERQGNTGRVQVLQPDKLFSGARLQPLAVCPCRHYYSETKPGWLIAVLDWPVLMPQAMPKNTSPIHHSNIPEQAFTIDEQVFYATAGRVDAGWNPQNNRDGIYPLKEGQWTNYNRQQTIRWWILYPIWFV